MTIFLMLTKHYLVLYPILKKYRRRYDRKDKYMGCPAAFDSGSVKSLGPDNSNRLDEWLLCLDKMVYSFEWLAKHDDWDGPDSDECYKEYCKVLKHYEKELKQLKKEDKKRLKEAPHAGLESLAFNRKMEIARPVFQGYEKKFEEHRKRIQEGIDLFAKHFSSLWL